MSFLYRIWAIFAVTIKRLWAQKGLTLATLVGLTAGVATIMAVPLYADAVNFRVLQERLSQKSEQSNRPPFTYMYDYIGAWHGPISWEDTRPWDAYLRSGGSERLGMPIEQLATLFETNIYRLFPTDSTNYNESGSLGIVSFATAESIEDHITITEGRFPASAEMSPDSTIEIAIAASYAEELGVQIGDGFNAFDFSNEDALYREIPVRVSGIWEATDETESYWFFQPAALSDLLLVPQETFVNRLDATIENAVHRGVWYLVMDGSGVSTESVETIVAKASAVMRQADRLLPDTSNPVTPIDAMQSYRRSVEELTVLLAAFNVPIITLVLAFIVLIVGLAVDQRRNEIAVMRSRGATPWQIVGFAVVEGVLLGFLALILGTLLALLLTQLMGKTRTFLDFSADYSLRIAMNQSAFRAGLMAVSLAIVAQILPTLSASRDTIVSYKLDQARSVHKPWWQRAWIDVILFLVTLYGFYLLQEQGSIISVGEAADPSDPFQNPLLFLLPSLAVFSLTLLFLRLFPWLMEALSWLLNKSDSVGLLLGSRQLARTPRTYAMPLILLVMTVSLATFTASLARTLDLQLFDMLIYRDGADVKITGAGIDYSIASNPFGLPTSTEEEDENSRNPAMFLPMTEYLAFPDVVSATRVGRYSAEAQVGTASTSGTFLGIDRSEFANASFWRNDFAPYKLGYLLNALGTVPDGLLVSEGFLAERALKPGDLFRVTVVLPEGDVELDAQIVGTLSYFPSWYEAEDGPLFVGNLDYLFSQIGGDMPYEVWLNTAEIPDPKAFDEALKSRDLRNWGFTEQHSSILAEQARPERQGLFGQLSVGFITAALLTVLGFFMYALFSFRKRFISLGILRAVGMSSRQMIVLIAFELAALILSGLTLGTALGVWISQLFIPYLQLGDRSAELIPPYLVEIDWASVYKIYGLFVLLFVIALAVLAILLQRMKIFQAIKLGETA